jgi:hypothetical protein
MSEEAKSTKDILGTVATIVNAYKLVINRGELNGVKLNQRYLIYGIGDEIKDPETGESLGALELVRGTGKVVHLQPKMATIETDMRRPSSRKISYREGGEGLYSFSKKIYGQEKVEEQDGEPIRVPFENPERGDMAKPI